MLEGARTLGIPADATEQYPQGLGTTDPSILELVEHVGEKLRFSAFGALEWMTDSQAGLATPQVVLAGIETHVCVLQTGLDLLAAGFDVFVVVDAVCSRRAQDAEFALQRLRDSGGADVRRVRAVRVVRNRPGGGVQDDQPIGERARLTSH
ncbi:MAG: isochorismatase family protein [Planctomycetaceae bacterium]